MIVAVFFLAAAALGWVRAGRRGGTMADRVQYAIAHGIAGGLAGFVLVNIAAHLSCSPSSTDPIAPCARRRGG
ncbi:MAG: hypothetical protein AAFR17_00335 [Pseudomonadota bacterium]